MKKLTELKKSYAELGAEIAKLEAQTPEERFAELVEGYEVKTDWKEYPNWLFFFKNGKFLGEFSLETQTFYASYPNLWKVFANEFEMENTDIQRFMSKRVEEHFKLKVSETCLFLKPSTYTVEEHFKLKVSETGIKVDGSPARVEEHFKLKVSETQPSSVKSAAEVEEHFKLK